MEKTKRQKLDVADSTSGPGEPTASTSSSSNSNSTAPNAEEEKSSTAEEEGNEEKSEEVKFNVRTHQNRSYRRSRPLDSDDDSDSNSSHWSPARENQPDGENNEAESTETNNNEQEYEIMGSRVIEFGNSSDSSSTLTTSSISSISLDTSDLEGDRHDEEYEPAENMEASSEPDEDPDVELILSDNSDSMSETDGEFEDLQNYKAETELVDKLIEYPKMDYDWNLKELLCRENGFTSRTPQTYGKIHSSFESRFYSSRHIVEKLRVEKKRLSKHKGCVNCLNFNKNGNILVTGSDDLRIILWDWSSRKIIHNFKSGHTSNIFQTKFVELNNSSASIVSSARDGTVRFSQIPPSGLTEIQPKKVYSHSSAVHKIALNPSTPSEILSAGEDGCVFSCDIRTNEPGKVISVEKSNSKKVRLYSISHHPYEQQICIGGTSQYVYVYDKRNYKKPLGTLNPSSIGFQCDSHKQVTCALYNCRGDEILASYSYDNAYLFKNRGAYLPGHTHSYIGHLNRKTIKGINFFGPNSEYIISGSDCGNVFFWDKENESIVNVFKGDTHIVNCLEPHPTIPVMAVSGLDNNIKIVSPGHKLQPGCSKEKIKDVLLTNVKRKQNMHVNNGAGLIIDIFQEFMRRERNINSSSLNSTDDTQSMDEYMDDNMGSEDSLDDEDAPSEIRPCVTQ